jgi:hypothetical protein
MTNVNTIFTPFAQSYALSSELHWVATTCFGRSVAIIRKFTNKTRIYKNTTPCIRPVAKIWESDLINEISFSHIAEMLSLRSVTQYTRLDKIRNEVIRKELEFSGIQDVILKYNQNLINHLERMDNTRLPKHALNYKPRGRRDRGRPRKRWQCVDTGTGQTT